jgi:hypothetical protein
MKWLARQYSFSAGRYTGDYYDLSTINWFVDSDLGDDSNAGTAAAPWSTIGKLISTGSVVNGHRVMINGIFTENTIITKELRIIGCGGGRNGKTIFNNGGGGNYIRYTANLLNHSLENVETTNYTTALAFLTYSTAGSKTITGIVNCILDNIFISQLTTNVFFTFLNFRFCILKNCLFNFVGSSSSTRFYIGNNNTLFNCSKTGGATSRVYIENNNHINNTMEHVVDGVNNIVNTDGQYFSPSDNDFNFPTTSPLYLTGTLDTITGIPNNVGAGRLGEFFNADSFEFKVIGGAVYTNTEPDGDDIFRTNDTIDGYFESGIIQLANGRRRGVIIGIHNSFNFSGGKLTKLIQESSGLTVRQGLDCQIIYGNSQNEVIAKRTANEWLLHEYGKPVTVTVSGGNTYGNADANFDPSDFLLPDFEYFKLRFRFKNA